MKKPTPIELQHYAREIGFFGFDHNAFLDHYDSNGWYVGKTKMKDWKAAVRTWKRMAPQFKQGKPFLPINKRNEKINQLNRRKAELLRMDDSVKVRQELEQIRIQLIDL
jgi:hypothetical protein